MHVTNKPSFNLIKERVPLENAEIEAESEPSRNPSQPSQSEKATEEAESVIVPEETQLETVPNPEPEVDSEQQEKQD